MPQNVFFTWVPQISCQNHSVHWGTHTHTHTRTHIHTHTHTQINIYIYIL